MRNFLKDILGDQRGMAFIMALVVLAITGLLSVPLLLFLSGVLPRSAKMSATVDRQYSAGAITEDALWRLSYDPAFITAVVAAPQTYSLWINGAWANVTVSLFDTTAVTPTPVPTPTPGPGLYPVAWTIIAPGVVYLPLNPGAAARLTIYMRNPGTAQATLKKIRELLPPGFEYAGALATAGMVDNNGNPLTLAKLGPPWGGPQQGPPWPYTGPNPHDSCNDVTTTQASNQKRLDWTWSGSNTPRVPPGGTGEISFNIVVGAVPLPPAMYFDALWLEFNQQQCSTPFLQAGAPSSVSIAITALVDATQGNTSLSSQVAAAAGESEITAQSYGN